jgi:hypothetical protein
VSFKVKTFTVYGYTIDKQIESYRVSLKNKYRYLLREINEKNCIFFQKIHASNSVLLVKIIIVEIINVYQWRAS